MRLIASRPMPRPATWSLAASASCERRCAVRAWWILSPEILPKKKRGGQPGNQNSKGKRNAAGSHDGAPPGNKNAEKDGAYSTVFFDMLSAEELKITESVPLGGREALEHEMKILKFREHKILAKIAEYESQPEDALFVSSLLDMRTPGGRGKDKKDGANQTMGMYSKSCHGTERRNTNIRK